MSHSRPRSIVYVDGQNFFRGVLKGTPDKWLDLLAYFSALRPNDQLVLIRYFTAKLFTGGERQENQEAYLLALDTLRPRVEPIFGRYKSKKINCTVSTRICSLAASQREFRIPEEKRTDVNIAVHMLDDARQQKCDVQILVTGDSDLVPAIDMVKQHFSMPVVVYVPVQKFNPYEYRELGQVVGRKNLRQIPAYHLRAAQFPDPVTTAEGVPIAKPVNW